jgi:hypothetical protein
MYVLQMKGRKMIRWMVVVWALLFPVMTSAHVADELALLRVEVLRAEASGPQGQVMLLVQNLSTSDTVITAIEVEETGVGMAELPRPVGVGEVVIMQLAVAAPAPLPPESTIVVTFDNGWQIGFQFPVTIRP